MMPQILDAVFASHLHLAAGASASAVFAEGPSQKLSVHERLDRAALAWRAHNPTAHRALSLHALAMAPAQRDQAHAAKKLPAAQDAVSQVVVDALFQQGAALIDAGDALGGLYVLWRLVRLEQSTLNYRLMAKCAAAASDVLAQLDESAPLGHVYLEPRRGAALNLSMQRLTVLAQMVMAFGKFHQALISDAVAPMFIASNGQATYDDQLHYAHDMLLAAAQEAHMLCRETAQACMAIYGHAGVMRDISAGLFGADPTKDARVAAHFAALRWPHADAFAAVCGPHLLTHEPDVKALHDAVYIWQLESQREIVCLVRELMPEALNEVEAFRAPHMHISSL